MGSLITSYLNSRNINYIPKQANGAPSTDNSSISNDTDKSRGQGLLSLYDIKAEHLRPTSLVKKPQGVWKNTLRENFQNNKVKMLAIIPRTFNAKDLNGNGVIEEDKGEA